VPAGNYWVSATSFGCPSILRWCNGLDNPVFDTSKSPWITWKNGKPSSDPLKQCVAVEFKRTPPYMKFFKSECKEKHLSMNENLGPNEGNVYEYMAIDLASLNYTNSITVKTKN